MDMRIYIQTMVSLFLLFSPYVFKVERFGKPTWRRLVEAVKDEVGGNNPALAEMITRVGNHIHY